MRCILGISLLLLFFWRAALANEPRRAPCEFLDTFDVRNANLGETLRRALGFDVLATVRLNEIVNTIIRREDGLLIARVRNPQTGNYEYVQVQVFTNPSRGAPHALVTRNFRRASGVAQLQRVPISWQPNEMVPLYARETEQQGSLVPVRRSSGAIDIGEVIAVNRETGELTIAVHGGTRTASISETVDLMATRPSSAQRPNHFQILDPSWLPDGSLFPSASENGDYLMVHRTRDVFVRDLLAEAGPLIRAPVREWFFRTRPPTTTEIVERTVAEITSRLTHSHASPENDANVARLAQQRRLAQIENRARLAGDALHLGRGVCKEFAIFTVLLLQDAGVPARYVRGLHNGQGHAWVEFRQADGTWRILEPQNGVTSPLTDYGRQGGPFENYRRPGPLAVEFARAG